MNKKKIIILTIVSIILIIIIGIFFYPITYAKNYNITGKSYPIFSSTTKNGNYYQLTLSPSGHIEVVKFKGLETYPYHYLLEGNILKDGSHMPFSSHITFTAKGKTDPTFLNIQDDKMKAIVYFGHTKNFYGNMKSITISTKSDKLTFVETFGKYIIEK